MGVSNFEYKFKYTGIFSLNYFIQGINQSIFTTVIPVYLFTLGSVDLSALSLMLSLVLVPFILKFFFGLLGDKVGSKRFGRRKPWIIGSASFSGIMWIVITVILLSITINTDIALTIFTYMGVLVVLGIAMSDTAMDGFIIDICPKELLGRTTGMVWAFRSLGIIVGGPMILLLLGFVHVFVIFIGVGVLTIIFSIVILAIKHREPSEKIDLKANLKTIVKTRENLKVFGFSFFMAIVDGVIFVFLALFILIQLGIVPAVGVTTSILEEDANLYTPQAIITFLTGIGVLAGALIGGYVADKKSRRLSLYIAVLLTAGALLLLLIPLPSMMSWILLIFAIVVGSSSGWSNSAFSAITTQYSQQYPETPSTYYSICTSFVNFGTQLGLLLTGLVFNSMAATISDTIVIFSVVFITMIILSTLVLIPFSLLTRSKYEIRLDT
ncbi:MAG: MFS transporter [Promethearchaeota archaeon]|jgi:MFS family permease